MSAWNITLHWIHFFAPALFVSVVLSLATGWRVRSRFSRGKAFAINFVAGSLALTAAMAYFGNDGKMWGYALMCAVSALAAAAQVRS